MLSTEVLARLAASAELGGGRTARLGRRTTEEGALVVRESAECGSGWVGCATSTERRLELVRADWRDILWLDFVVADGGCLVSQRGWS